MTVLHLSCGIWELLVAACGIQLPDQESNLNPQHWECRVLAMDHQGSPTSILGSNPSLLFPHPHRVSVVLDLSYTMKVYTAVGHDLCEHILLTQ